jgi:acyl-CoA reductase-like NAD-dependent aldehyde dehydrogenase
MKTYKSANPFNQSVFAEHELMNGNELENSIKAELAFAECRFTSFKVKSHLLHTVAGNLRSNKESYARIIS